MRAGAGAARASAMPGLAAAVLRAGCAERTPAEGRRPPCRRRCRRRLMRCIIIIYI